MEFTVYLLQLVCPQPCFDEIFVKHNFLNGTFKIQRYSYLCRACVIR